MPSPSHTNPSRTRNTPASGLTRAIYAITLGIAICAAAVGIAQRPVAPVATAREKARADLRSVAIGLEAYYIDNNTYPPARNGMLPPSLTTPVAYFATLPLDYYTSQTLKTPYRYYSKLREGWFAYSTGPDLDYDFTPENLATLYNPTSPQPLPALVGSPYNYDPTNGPASSGDIFRVK